MLEWLNPRSIAMQPPLPPAQRTAKRFDDFAGAIDEELRYQTEGSIPYAARLGQRPYRQGDRMRLPASVVGTKGTCESQIRVLA